MNNTETYSEPSDDPVSGWQSSSREDSGFGVSPVPFIFIQGQPGPRGFVFDDKAIRAVFLAGDFNGWNPTAQPLERDGDGYWEAEIDLPIGRHEYLFVADGVWRADPMAEFIPNTFGGVNSVVTVRSRVRRTWPHFPGNTPKPNQQPKPNT